MLPKLLLATDVPIYRQAIFVCRAVLFAVLFCRGSLPAHCQPYQPSSVEANPYIYYGNQGSNGQAITTNTDPLSPGAQSTPPLATPVQGQPPPIGSVPTTPSKPTPPPSGGPFQPSNVEANPYVYAGAAGDNGQSTTTLRDPLSSGAQSTAPLATPVQGQPPPIGSIPVAPPIPTPPPSGGPFQPSNVETNPYVYSGQAGDNGQSTTTLRTPLSPGAQSTQPEQAAIQGMPPPIGSGQTPLPVTPGMSGTPLGGPSNVFPQMSNSGALTGTSSPPSKANNTAPSWSTSSYGLSSPLYLPAVSPLDTTTVNSELSPYLQPPPSTPGTPPPGVSGDNSGLIYARQATNSTYNAGTYYPPANIGGVGTNGGITGTAPTTKWGGQTTRDYGLRRTTTNGQTRSGNYNTDYGQSLDSLLSSKNSSAASAITHVTDGPRTTNYLNWQSADSGTESNAANTASDYTDAVRSANRADAITTWNLFGSRQNFRFQSQNSGNDSNTYSVPHSSNSNGSALYAQQTNASY